LLKYKGIEEEEYGITSRQRELPGGWKAVLEKRIAESSF
jgi:uncharacterized protein YbdZ (MbtH family)